MKETEQTLFLKSNLLHIRTNEGEFEVSNQNELHYDEEEDAFILNGTKSINWEWPGGVEFETIAPHPECYKARECLQLTNGLNCSQAYDARTRSTSLCAKAYKLARLIPEEKKAESAYNSSEQSEIVNKHRWESDFKEFEDLAAKQRDIEPEIAEVLAKHGHELFESSEPQEKRCKACEIERNDEQVKQMPEHTCKKGSPMDIAQPKSAPSESQEELWKIVYGASNTITRDGFIESMKEHFKITRKPE